MRWAVVGLVLAHAANAAADRSFASNILGGPVVGVSWGRGHPTGLLLGVEGGGGLGPERVNLGFTRGADRQLGYVELDPWLGLGFSLGFGLDLDGEVQPVIGAWEGAPVADQCKGEGFHFLATISVGFRYTGVYEVYLAPKFGGSNNFCATD